MIPGSAAAVSGPRVATTLRSRTRRAAFRGTGGWRLRRLLLTAAALSVGVACIRSPTPEDPGSAAAARPPIVLISIDTLRSDRLPAYGYPHVETPAIDRLAADGVLFERAYTHANTTLPSHASVFTGLLPHEHGVRDNMGYRLDESIPTLAAELRRHGYATGGFVSSWVLRSETGLGRGFEVWDDGVAYETGRPSGQNQRSGTETLAAASEWLAKVADAPFFLFLHLYEPHAPYDPPMPFAARYSDPYDGEVAAADAVVAALIRRLEELDVYEEALVILLSDHGEGLMDHGEMDHVILIYREVLQVPLIVKLPEGRRSGDRVAVNAQLSDVAPAVYALVGVEPPAPLAGVDLLEIDRTGPGTPPRQVLSESVYPRIHFGWSELVSIVEGDLHFIESPDPELFRLSVDPRERNNVIQQERTAARRFRAALSSVDRTLTSPVETDAETRRRLASLGYLSGGARDGTAPRADPKDRLGIVADLGRVPRLIDSGELAEAETALRAVLHQDPRLVLAWQQLGDVLERGRRLEQALAAYRKAFELSGGDAVEAGVKVAELLLIEGRVDAAREHALAVAERAPMAYDVLAQAALIEDDFSAAEEYLRRAVAGRGRRVAPLITRLAWLIGQDRFEETLALSDEVLAEFGDRRDRRVLGHLYFYRGAALTALGSEGAAEGAYREAISLRPELLGAYSSLAFLQAHTGRGAEVGKTLEKMVKVNPRPSAWAEAVRALRAMNDPRSADGVLGEALRRWPDAEELRLLAEAR